MLTALNVIFVKQQLFGPLTLPARPLLNREQGELDVAADAQFLEYSVTVAIDCFRA